MSDEAKTIAEIEALLALANQEVFLRDESPHPHEEQNDRIRAARTQIANHARKTFIPALLAIVKRQQEREAVLRNAIQEIAKQRLHSEIAECDPDEIDWLSGYEGCVKVARKALVGGPTNG